MKTFCADLQLRQKKRLRIVALCLWLSSVIWDWDPVSQPGRKQVLSPVVLLSHYASCRLKAEPAPVNIPRWLWKKQKCRREKKKEETLCGEIQMFHIPQIQLKENDYKNSAVLLHIHISCQLKMTLKCEVNVNVPQAVSWSHSFQFAAFSQESVDWPWEFKCVHCAVIPVACVVIWGCACWGGSWGVAQLCSGHSCAKLSRGSDVMYNGSPQGWRDEGRVRGRNQILAGPALLCCSHTGV